MIRQARHGENVDPAGLDGVGDFCIQATASLLEYFLQAR
jgi:hypothetical protein